MNVFGETVDKPALGPARNLDTLIRAANNGDLCLMECRWRATGEKVAAVCAASRDADGSVIFTPLAVMMNGNPYDMLLPPLSEEDNVWQGSYAKQYVFCGKRGIRSRDLTATDTHKAFVFGKFGDRCTQHTCLTGHKVGFDNQPSQG